MDKLIQNLRKVNKLYDDREYNFVDNPIYMDEIIDAETSLTPNSINSVGGHSNITSGTRKIGGRNAQISIVWNVPLNKIGKYSRSIVARSNTFGEFNRTNARRTGAPAKGDKYEYYLHMEDII